MNWQQFCCGWVYGFAGGVMMDPIYRCWCLIPGGNCSSPVCGQTMCENALVGANVPPPPSSSCGAGGISGMGGQPVNLIYIPSSLDFATGSVKPAACPINAGLP